MFDRLITAKSIIDPVLYAFFYNSLVDEVGKLFEHTATIDAGALDKSFDRFVDLALRRSASAKNDADELMLILGSLIEAQAARRIVEFTDISLNRRENVGDTSVYHLKHYPNEVAALYMGAAIYRRLTTNSQKVLKPLRAERLFRAARQIRETPTHALRFRPLLRLGHPVDPRN